MNHEVIIEGAVRRGWRLSDIVGLLGGPARYANGQPVPCCESCGRPEYEDGLIPTEQIADDIIGGFRCPNCLAARSDGGRDHG